MTANPNDWPDHIGEIFGAIERLHADHRKTATPLQKGVNRITAFLAHPETIGFISTVILLWVVGNLIVAWTGRHPWDPPPYSGLQTVATVAALYVTVLILATQNHTDQLADRREQLILQLAMLNDQKSAKIIQLLEEIRRDDPLIVNREDSQAEAMSKPSDTIDVVEAVSETTRPSSDIA